MPATREMLEGEAYWGRIRHIKQKLYIVEIVLISALAFILVFYYSDFQSNPFFISMDRLLWFALIMMLIVEIESFIFRMMQIRIARTFSTKHLMTTNSIRRAMIIIVVSVIVLIIFLLPSTLQAIVGAASHTGTVSYARPAPILPGDALGLSEAQNITLSCELVVDVYLVKKQDYYSYPGDWTSLKNFCLNGNNTRVNSSITIAIPPMSYEYLYLLVDPTTTDDEEYAVVSYTVHSKLSDTLTSFLPLMCVAFIVANAGWIAYLMPLSKKYAMKSIYK